MNTQRVIVTGLLALVAAGLCEIQAAAQVISWSNTNGGNFTTGANWTGGVVPTTVQTAGFTSVGFYTVTFATSVATNGLTTNDTAVTFAMGGHTYSVFNVTLQGDTTLQVNNGTILASGNIAIGTGTPANLGIQDGGRFIAGNVSVGTASGAEGNIGVSSGGRFESSGFTSFGGTSAEGNLSVANGGVAVLGGTTHVGQSGASLLNIAGTLESSGAMFLGTNAAATGQILISFPSGNWTHRDGAIITGNGVGTININAGSMNVQGAGADVSINSGDALNVNGGVLNVSGAGQGNGITIANAGIMSVLGGSVNIGSTGTGSGLTVQSGGTVSLGNGGSITTTNFTRQGTFTLNGGTFTVDGGVFDNNASAFNIGTFGNASFVLQNGATTTGVTSVAVGNTAASNIRRFEILSGSTLTTTATSFVGSSGGGLMRVSGAGSTWNASNIITIGDGGSLGNGTLIVENGGNVTTNGNILQTGTGGTAGTLTVQSGGTVTAGNVNLGAVAGPTSTATVSGSGSILNASNLFVGGTSASDGGTTTLTLGAGSTTNVTTLTRIRAPGTLNLAGGTLNTFNLTRTGGFNFTDGTLRMTGGSFAWNSTNLDLVGGGVGQNPHLIFEGNTTSSGISNLNVGSNSQEGTVTIGAGATLGTTGVTINQRGTLNLEGGTLGLATFTKTGTFNWNSGTMRFNSGANLNDGTLTAMLGTAHSLGNGKTISSLGTLTSSAALTLDGGAVTGATTLNNDATLTLNQGSVTANTFNNNAGRIVQLNGTTSLTGTTAINNSGTLRMNSQTASLSGGGLSNNASGTISGTGQINNSLTNNGTVRVTGSEHLLFTGSGNLNVMNMNLAGGTLEFTQTLFNRDGAAITGRGTLITSSATPGGLGLTNEGLMSFSAGTTDVYGDVDNDSDGRIVTGGAGITTFFDDVVHNGLEIRTFGGSRTVFFGNQSGAGAFTGTGVVEYAGDLRPGNSPANVTYEGDVFFNSSAGLFIELGGLTPGTQYDRLTVAGLVTVDGLLDVATIGGFVPTAGNQFIIIDNGGTDAVQGTFSGLAEGAQFLSHGHLYQITYQGGTGNDVVLTAVPEPLTLALFGMAAAGAGGGWYWRRQRRLLADASADGATA